MKQTLKKQILRFGQWNHPNAKDGVLNIDKSYAQKLVDNWSRSPFAPVTRGHNADPVLEQNPNLVITKNIKGLEMDDNGVNAVLDIDEQELDKYNDVSASIDENGVDHETNESIGPVLRHVAMVMNPFIKKLDPFVPLGEPGNIVINLSEVKPMDTEEKKNKKVDPKAEAAQEETAKPEAETKKVDAAAAETATDDKAEDKDATTEVADTQKEKESEDKPAPTVDNAEETKYIAELEELTRKQALELSERRAKDGYEKLLREGKILPVQKDTFLALSMNGSQTVDLSDGSKKTVGDLVLQLLSQGPKLINLTSDGANTEGKEAKPTGDVSVNLRDDMRKAHPEMSDDQFDDWFEKNKTTIAKYDKQN